MNVLFFIICALSLVFFAVFLFECAKPSRKTKRAPVVRKSPEVQVADSVVGRRFLVHIEEQMAEFLSQHRTATVLLTVAMFLLPVSMRAQMQPTADESTANGWQSYGRFNNRLGVGGQILWRPTGSFSFVGNQNALGQDALGVPGASVITPMTVSR